MAKPAMFAIFFAAFIGSVMFADTADINGEWIVLTEDAHGAGVSIPVVVENNADELPSVGGRISSRPASMPNATTARYNLVLLPPNATFDFDTNGSKLTGALLRGKTEKPILNGTVSGNGEKITFTIRETVKDKTYSYYYRGEISGDVIKFEVTPEYGDAHRRWFTAKKVIR